MLKQGSKILHRHVAHMKRLEEAKREDEVKRDPERYKVQESSARRMSGRAKTKPMYLKDYKT